jgi:hypothetical protein
MRVDLTDGACRSCGGPLDILDTDDVSMNVACAECGDNYDVETDAFGDGCMKYYFPIVSSALMAAVDDDE